MFDLSLDAGDKLETFLKQFPVFPNAFLVGGPADIFSIELTDQVIVESFLGSRSTLMGFIVIALEELIDTIDGLSFVVVWYLYFSSQLQKLKVEPVLLHYLSSMKVLEGNYYFDN